FSPDGKMLASSSSDNTLRLWDPDTGKEKKRFACPPVVSMFFAKEGQILAVQDWNKEVILWDLDKDKEIRRLSAERGMAVSPDGKFLAVAGAYGAIEILDVNTGQARGPQQEPRGPVLSLAFAPDSRTLASTSADRSVVLWDTVTGKPLQQFREH